MPCLSSICFLLCQPLPCEVLDCTSLTDLLALWKSDFIKSLIPLVIYTVFDECHRSRCVDLIAALICLFNGVVEWKVVTTRCSTKRWIMSPAGERWKGKMQNSWVVEESGRIKQGLPILYPVDKRGWREAGASYWTWCEMKTFQTVLSKFAVGCHRLAGVTKHMPEMMFYLLARFAFLLIYWEQAIIDSHVTFYWITQVCFFSYLLITLFS